MGLQIQELYGAGSPADLLDEAEQLPESLTLGELRTELGYASHEALLKGLFSSKAGSCLLGQPGEDFELKLRPRALHVLSEAYRAKTFVSVLSKPQNSDDDRLFAIQSMSDLMADSHASCRDAYECSCPELERVITAARAAGCFTARLTGAGLGGYAVGLVHDQDADEFVNKMSQYYVTQGVKDPSDVVFITEPGAGASFVRLE